MALGFLLGTAVYFCNHVLGNPVAITGIFGTMTIGMLIGLAVTAPLIAFMDGKWICVLGNFIAGIHQRQVVEDEHAHAGDHQAAAGDEVA